MTVCEYIEEGHVWEKVSIRKGKDSRFALGLLMQYYERKLGQRVEVFSYGKEMEREFIAIVEEPFILDGNRVLVVEGAPKDFEKKWKLAKGTYVVMESEGGELEADHYSARGRRNYLKILTDWHIKRSFSLRMLINADWTGRKVPEEYESVVRKMAVMDWSGKETVKYIDCSLDEGSLLKYIKKGEKKKLFEIVEKKGGEWVWNTLGKVVLNMVQLKLVKSQEWGETKMMEELGIGWNRLQMLTDLSVMVTEDDLAGLVRELVDLEGLARESYNMAINMLIVRNKVGVKREA